MEKGKSSYWCTYCSQFHLDGYKCEKKKQVMRERWNKCDKKKKKVDDHNSFHNTAVWHNKAEVIMKRDLHRCLYCYYVFNRSVVATEVHHIYKLRERYDKRLDDDNLISLCTKHHKYADADILKKEDLIALVEKSMKESEECLL